MVEQARSDPAAFGQLYERYVKQIYNYVYYRTGDHHEAEELTAQTFHRAYTHLSGYRDRGIPFSAWLYRIAHNLVANWHRDQARRRVVSLDEVAPTTGRHDGPDAVVEGNQEREHLLALVRELAPERQQLLIQKFAQHLSNAEIGDIMGRSEGAIKSLYHRTLVVLRDELTGGSPAAPSTNGKSSAEDARQTRWSLRLRRD